MDNVTKKGAKSARFPCIPLQTLEKTFTLKKRSVQALYFVCGLQTPHPDNQKRLCNLHANTKSQVLTQ